ncbi:MAG: PQQ-dependent sugar dehydrogenase [Candidatus Kerfeldbacteria bacterium]|nr:PQQ-dependent sugar dehydrogenase [Candidatus Kerfeldbacteria bacterium]
MTPRTRTILGVGSAVVLIAAALWARYIQTVTSPLQILSRFNPRNAPSADLTPAEPAELVTQTLNVPDQYRRGVFAVARTLELPSDLTISVFASGLQKARFMAFSPTGVLYVTDLQAGKVYAFPDADANGIADSLMVVADGLDNPHGIAFDGSDLYVAETERVHRYRDGDNDLKADEDTIIIPNLPKGGVHVTRTILIGPDGKLSVSSGSSCNACDDDPRRAAVLRFNKDGSGEERFAWGLRNSVGMVVRPGTGEIWATDNGRDLLGDDIPPDEINVLSGGNDYGWPDCYGGRIADTTRKNSERCSGTIGSRIDLQAHSAPLGLRFVPQDGPFAAAYGGDLLVAFHGSWNRREPTGYKVIRATVDGGTSVVADFIRGWLVSGKAWGRPVDVLFGPDGALYVSDDEAGAIYRVTSS